MSVNKQISARLLLQVEPEVTEKDEYKGDKRGLTYGMPTHCLLPRPNGTIW
jgi:hypothetical protein